MLTRFHKDRSGATSIEYSVLVSGVALVIVTAVYTLGEKVTGLFNVGVNAFN